MLRVIVKAAVLGGIVTAAACLLLFLGIWAHELLLGYDFPQSWDRGLIDWMYLGMIVVGAGTVLGGLSGAAWQFFGSRRSGTI